MQDEHTNGPRCSPANPALPLSKLRSQGILRPVQNRERERTHESRRARVERNLDQNCDFFRRWRLAQNRERAWTYGCHATPVHPKKHHDRTTGIKSNLPKCRAVYLCVTSESSRASIARAVVCLSWSLVYFCYPKTGGGQTNASIPQDGRASSSDPVTWRHSLMRLSVCFPIFSMLQNGASGALDAFTDTARGVPRDNGIRYSTRTWYRHHTRARSTTKDSLEHDEHVLLGRVYLAPAPSRAVAHLVLIQKEIGCTQCRPKNEQTI